MKKHNKSQCDLHRQVYYLKKKGYSFRKIRKALRIMYSKMTLPSIAVIMPCIFTKLYIVSERNFVTGQIK